jgi:hypothetical protein
MGTRSKLLIFLAALAALPAAGVAATDAEAARAANEKSSREVLQRVFAACPGAKKALRATEGFATFAGVGDGGGSGVAKPTRTRTPVYIQFESTDKVAAKRDLVFLFETRDAFSRFAVQGATFGGEAAAAQADCSQALAPGVRVIQLEGSRLVGGAVPAARYSKASLN